MDNNTTAAQPLDLDRYDIDCDGLSLKHKNGVWVAYEDVAALIAPASQPVAPADIALELLHYPSDDGHILVRLDEVQEVLARRAAVAPSDAKGKADESALEFRTCCEHPDCTTCAGRGGFYRIGATGKADAAIAGELLAALRDFVDNSQEHDVGGGDVVIATCESRERAAALLEKYRDKSLGVCGIKPSECPDSSRCGCAQSPATSAADAKDAARYRQLKENDFTAEYCAYIRDCLNERETVDLDVIVDRAAMAAAPSSAASKEGGDHA